MQKVFQFLRSGVKTLLLLGCLMHIGLTMLYNTPMNPFKAKNLGVIQGYIGTFFPQNWSLFAPNPVDTDFEVLIKPLSQEQYDAWVSHDEVMLPEIERGWFGVLSPLYSASRQNRLIPYERLSRPLYNSLRNYLGRNQTFSELSRSIQSLPEEGEERQKLEETYEQLLKASQNESKKLITRYLDYIAADLGLREQGYTHIVVRLRETKIVPWSKRNDESFEREFRESTIIVQEITPVERPIKLFERGSYAH